jgi:hypothetical protein
MYEQPLASEHRQMRGGQCHLGGTLRVEGKQPSHLSRNALHKIVLGYEKKAASVRDEYFVLQVVENKKKEQSAGKSANNIKQRLMLSDGTSILIAMVTKFYDKVEVSPFGKA